MLLEYALTPHVLDESANTDSAKWIECLRNILQQIYLDEDVACPIVVSGLHGDVVERKCSWLSAAQIQADQIRHPVAKRYARDLLDQIQKHGLLVMRPACCDWPGEDEVGWAKEAHDSSISSKCPMENIIGSLESGATHEYGGTRLDAVLEPKTWRGMRQTFSPAAFVPTTRAVANDEYADYLKQQIAYLRPILAHAKRLDISAPYYSLLDFVREVILTAFDRPDEFGAPHVNVYHGCPSSINAFMEWEREQMPNIAGNGKVTWYFLEDQYRERLLLASDSDVPTEGGQMLWREPRFGVGFSHCPGEGEQTEAEPSTWTLQSKSQLNRHYHDLKERIEQTQNICVLL